MNPLEHNRAYLTRRQFFGRTAIGLGAAALGSLLNPALFAAAEKGRFGGLPGLPHFAPKAKRVIYLLQNGA
ncbi:MAG TPA: sulfatase, partial [Verrucomicrobiae bacterium]